MCVTPGVGKDIANAPCGNECQGDGDPGDRFQECLVEVVLEMAGIQNAADEDGADDCGKGHESKGSKVTDLNSVSVHEEYVHYQHRHEQEVDGVAEVPADLAVLVGLIQVGEACEVQDGEHDADADGAHVEEEQLMNGKSQNAGASGKGCHCSVEQQGDDRRSQEGFGRFPDEVPQGKVVFVFEEGYDEGAQHHNGAPNHRLGDKMQVVQVAVGDIACG